MDLLILLGVAFGIVYGILLFTFPLVMISRSSTIINLLSAINGELKAIRFELTTKK